MLQHNRSIASDFDDAPASACSCIKSSHHLFALHALKLMHVFSVFATTFAGYSCVVCCQIDAGGGCFCLCKCHLHTESFQATLNGNRNWKRKQPSPAGCTFPPDVPSFFSREPRVLSGNLAFWPCNFWKSMQTLTQQISAGVRATYPTKKPHGRGGRVVCDRTMCPVSSRLRHWKCWFVSVLSVGGGGGS